ncbi:MAG: FmdB family zinc ribbon protein [Phycisphaerae bacterium]
MPTYDYACDSCGHTFEKYQSITAPTLKKCPACTKNKLRRLIGTGAGVIFKGGGFYETDYRSEGYKKGAEAEKKAGGSDAKGGESNSGDIKSGDGKSGENKAGEAKPAEAKPSEAKPTEAKPAAAAKPADRKSGGSGGSKSAGKD